MKIGLRIGSIEKLNTHALFIPLFQGIPVVEEVFQKIDRRLNGMLSDLIDANPGFAKEGRFTPVFTNGKLPAECIVLAGLGENEKLTLEKIRKFGGGVARYTRRLNVPECCVLTFGYGLKKITVDVATQALTEGISLGAYQFTFFKSKKKDDDAVPLREIALFPVSEVEMPQIKAGLALGNILSESTNFVREVVNKPANIITPVELANIAKSVARNTKIKCKILNLAQIKKEKMGGMIGVSQGSKNEPRFIVLEYRGSKKADTHCIVGKGVTFDSGGLSLKPPKYMEDMKSDKAGATAVMGIMQAVARLKLSINIVGIMPCVENMPSGSAQRPGDIITTASGKTVEVLNTDAEGRLILADGLHYATKYKPKLIIDLATLTGACVVALGYECCGVMSNDQALAQKLIAAGEQSGERAWQLPLFDEYFDDIKTDNADIKNVGAPGGDAGAIEAAMFLKQFVGEYPWAHLDIAGPAFLEKAKGYLDKGASGFSVRLMVQFFRNLCEE